MKRSASTIVDVPIDKVWSVLSDHQGIENWIPASKVTMTEQGSPEPNGVGAVRRIAAPGPVPAIVERVTRYEAPHVLGYEALSGVLWQNHRGEVNLTETDGGTRIEWTLSGDGPVAVAGIPLLAVGLLQLFARGVKRA
ncbi:SRPBCC family protein [Mycobacterium sp. OTB74]|uniref:SRPBCC family protein n=1 Tax=Mycobacterium sp. OTB74 TaxID=1853452 RepID=UPI00247657A3|nr:SRPBCC family protein [Mycobacterium sp. OTB74]MDH6243542.1 uncharacterized protein YndB with AHSA1/START domain [Mycobacterium sp. OTB74]